MTTRSSLPQRPRAGPQGSTLSSWWPRRIPRCLCFAILVSLAGGAEAISAPSLWGPGPESPFLQHFDLFVLGDLGVRWCGTLDQGVGAMSPSSSQERQAVLVTSMVLSLLCVCSRASEAGPEGAPSREDRRRWQELGVYTAHQSCPALQDGDSRQTLCSE